jgi:hypothetical protein
MIHSPAELGSLGKSVMNAHAEVLGDDRLKTFLESIEGYWDEVTARIISAGFYSSKSSSLHIFMDGLPNADEDIVRKVAEDLIASKTIPAYRIVARLRKYGATVYGTENTELLLEEYRYYKGLSEGKVGDAEASRVRLAGRDVAIALRIQEVMASDSDIGILFIGRAHDVVGKLPDEFTVVCL